MIQTKSIHILLTILFLSSILGISFSQSSNLIPNSSFELFKKLPDDVAQAKECLISWTIPNKVGRGEYYHAKCDSKKAGTKKNHFGQQNPHSGDAYVGLCVAKNFREFLQVELTSALIKSETYSIKLYVSCADKPRLSSLDEFNILFSNGSFSIPKNENLLVTPEIKFTGNFSNQKDWIELSSSYIANGTEKYMTFGSFMYEDKGKTHGEINGAFKYAHYYVDDISIVLNEKEKSNRLEKRMTESIIVDTSINFVPGEIYVLNNLQFESGKSILLTNNYTELDKLLNYLEKNTNQKLLISGHTDNIGNKADNKNLSLERANAIKQYLISKGIPENLIAIEGRGDELPIDSNETAEGRKKNRRVEILFIK
jgi:outer membrane protein OmpA-like peptidoglycan-associated protein